MKVIEFIIFSTVVIAFTDQSPESHDTIFDHILKETAKNFHFPDTRTVKEAYLHSLLLCQH